MLKAILKLLVFLFLICWIPGIPPTEKLVSYRLQEPAKPFGPLARNNLLSLAKILLREDIRGPESFIEIQDPKNGTSEIYTGVIGGSILKIIDGGKHFEVVATTGQCMDDWDAENCGRPLGLTSDGKGNIVIVDAYKGILTLDPKTGKLTTLVDVAHSIEGFAPGVPNSAVVASNGYIYWTDSSRYKFHTGLIEMLGSATGRLLRFDPLKGESTVLLEGLHFANGIQLSPNEDFLVVAELFRHQLTRYWLKGPKTGNKDIFALMPGMPDNIKPSPNGNMLVGIPAPRFSDLTNFWTDPATFASRPWLRFILLKTLSIFKLLFDVVGKYAPGTIGSEAARLSYKVLGAEVLAAAIDKYGLVVEVDWNGNITRSWHDPTGRIHTISEAYFSKDGSMWLGSPVNHFLARIPPPAETQ